MVNHQRHGLALFLNAVPGHQVGQGLSSAGQRVQPQLLFAALKVFFLAGLGKKLPYFPSPFPTSLRCGL